MAPQHPANELTIHLEQRSLILRGECSDSTGCVLRGCLVLRNQQPLRIKCIKLKFSGKMRAEWNERKPHHYRCISTTLHGKLIS